MPHKPFIEPLSPDMVVRRYETAYAEAVSSFVAQINDALLSPTGVCALANKRHLDIHTSSMESVGKPVEWELAAIEKFKQVGLN